ncbi:MAG: IS66 family insertion sequence element accessory protein TnpB [Acidobacteriota bacterium]
MIGSSRRLSVFAFNAPVDMRKGFDGLAALVREQLDRDPTNGALYLFVSRNRIRAKVLMWDGTGLCLYAKRLEQGRFAPLWGREREGEVKLSMSELALYLEGCQEVGRRPISPPEIDPNRKILDGLPDTLGPCSTSNPSTIPRSCAPSVEPTKPPSAYWSTASRP